MAKDAIELFEKICTEDLVSWNTVISGLCHYGDYHGVIDNIYSDDPGTWCVPKYLLRHKQLMGYL